MENTSHHQMAIKSFSLNLNVKLYNYNSLIRCSSHVHVESEDALEGVVVHLIPRLPKEDVAEGDLCFGKLLGKD